MLEQGGFSVDNFVSESRVWTLLMDIAQHGATAANGVNRQAFSREDVAAKRAIADWAAERGFQVFQDEIANLFVRREGMEPALAPVLVGSHLDSQPTGGKFDGAFGVVAGLEVLEALEQAGLRTRRPIEIVAWSNEEGSRFSPGAMGSAVFSGRRTLAEFAAITDRNGDLLKDSLNETLKGLPVPFRSSVGLRPHCYLEAHIEQGPLLEEAGVPIGIVKTIHGIRRFSVEVLGEEGHAGTTPMRGRKDAFVHAIEVTQRLAKLANDPTDTIRFTIGSFEVFPGSPNTIPGRAVFSIDLRHPDAAVLENIGQKLLELAPAVQGFCRVEVKEISFIRPTIFPDNMVDEIRAAARACGYESLDLNSGAGHDAMHLCAICPAAMAFIPCWRGISHNEKERANPADVAAGAKVLTEATLRLAS